LEETLPDLAGHSIAHVRLLVDHGEVEYACGGDGDLGACRIMHVLGDNITASWEINGSLDGWQVRREASDVLFAPRQAALPEDAGVFLNAQGELARKGMPRGEWQLQVPLEAMESVLAANTFTLPTINDVLTLSRHQLEQSGAWRVSNWQTFLTALGIAYIDPQLALAECKTALRLLAVDGILGAEYTANGPQRDISNPPVAAYCLWKIFQLTGDASLITEAYPILLRWHDWWWNARDGNHNRLLNWASPDETGMPEHPLYRTAPRDPKTGVLRVDDVGLCSLWALDAFALMRMALRLNDLDQATHLEGELNDISSRLNLMLWDPVQGAFRSRDWDGFPTDRFSATVLLAFIGAVPTRNHAGRLLDFLGTEFDSPFLIPTLGKDDPDFEDQLPWNGRVSPLLNYLICEGLRQFGQDEVAETVILSGLDLVKSSWQQHQLFDSYNAMSGQGDDIAQDPLAPTGMLFGALGITMLIDAEPWNGLRMGNLRGVDMAISAFPLQGALYDIASGPWGFSITRNNEPWFDLDRPVIIRNLAQTEHEISCSVKMPGGGPLRLRCYGYQSGDTVSIKVNGKATSAVVNDAGMVECTVDIEPPNGSGYGIWHRAA
jgi:hypothetical protein